MIRKQTTRWSLSDTKHVERLLASYQLGVCFTFACLAAVFLGLIASLSNSCKTKVFQWQEIQSEN